MNNHELYEAAMDAIRNLYNDKSVTVSECAINLQSLHDEIDIMLDALAVLGAIEDKENNDEQ